MQIRAGHPNYKTMSDTPETDAVYKIHPCDIYDYIPLEFARKLERERNQARDRQWADAIHSCHNECARPMCVLRRERDEWKEKADALLQALAEIQDAIGCGCGGDYGLCEDCSEAYNKTDALIKARETNQPKP